MLRRLHIENFGLVRSLSIELPTGFTSITGETGAGKSMLLGAVSAALGARVSREMLPEDKLSLVQCEFAAEDRFWLVRREFQAGRSRVTLNGEPILQKDLKELAPRLADLHGQRDLSQLLDPARHMILLDSMREVAPSRASHQAVWQDWNTCKQGLDGLNRQLAREEELKELRAFQLAELDELDAKPGEDKQLEDEHRVLANVEELKQRAGQVTEALFEGDQNLHDQLMVLRRELERAAKLDSSFNSPYQMLFEAGEHLQEAASLCRDRADSLELDPERLARVRERLELLDRMIRKYGGTLDALLERREELLRAADQSHALLREIQLAEREEQRLRLELEGARAALTKARQIAAERLTRELEPLLEELGIPAGRLVVAMEPAGSPFAADGAEAPRFLVSTNPDTPLGPLEEIASGGELSRIMLAFKSLLLKDEHNQCLIFDEIDSGISGRAALAVAGLMRRLAAQHQLLCITHLPQIAAAADQQLGVEKFSEGSHTRVEAGFLDREARILHLARLQSGRDTVKDQEAAARLLDQA